MKKYLISATAISILMMVPLHAYPQTQPEKPPVSQPLVAEGTFALQLASALKLDNVSDEAKAEDLLASIGIAPRNGWIADYPMTPLVIGEIRESMLSAVDAGKVSMSRDVALKTFSDIAAQDDLAVIPASGEEQQDPSQYAYEGPDGINNYYYEQGPPPVTYYPPPPEYSYLYSWYPYPFYGYGSFFPGFYIMSDFAFFGGRGFHHHFFANHFRGRFEDRAFRSSRFGNIRIFSARDFGSFHGSRIWDNQSPTHNRIWSFNNHGINRGFAGNSFNRGFSRGPTGGFRGGGGFGMMSRGNSFGGSSRGFGMSRGGSFGGFRGGGGGHR